MKVDASDLHLQASRFLDAEDLDSARRLLGVCVQAGDTSAQLLALRLRFCHLAGMDAEAFDILRIIELSPDNRTLSTVLAAAAAE